MSKTINSRRRRTAKMDSFVVQEYSFYSFTEEPSFEDLPTGNNVEAPIILFKETIETDPDAKVKLTLSGIPYYENLPEGSERCKVYTQFYKLVNGAKRWKQENIELRIGMYFVIYSPGANRYFLRKVHEDLNLEKLKKYIQDKNLYLINKDQS
jgi:hypothetical protein